MSDTTPQWQKKSDALLRIHDENLKSGYYTDEYMAEQMSPEEAERIRDIRYRMGIEREPDSGFWGELSDETALSLNRGVRNMLKFVDADNAVESLDRVLARNQQWIPPEKRSVSGAVGGMIGSGVGSTLSTLPGMIAGAVAGSAIGGPAGTVVGLALPFMNTFAMQYEDVKQRNLDNGMDNGSATAEAVVETAMLSAVETMLGTVPGIGKLLKGKPTAGIAARALNKLTGKMGSKAATRFVTNTVKGVLGNAAEEGAEEAVQYLIGVAGESFSEYIGKDADFFNRLRENFSAKELGENALAGFVAGGALGGPGAVSDASRTNARIKFFGDYRENPSRYTRWFDERGNKLIIRGNDTGVSPAAVPAAGVTGAVDAQTAAETAPERTLAAPPSGLTVARNDAEAEIIDRYDNASENTLRSEAARLNLPDINPASADTTMLRQALTEHRLAELRSAPAVSETAPESAAVSTPVTADNSISRESIAPAENLPSVPVVAPETPVAVEQTVPSAPVQSPPAVPQPSGNILSYMDDSMVEYTPETPSAPVAPVDTTSGAVAGIAPSAPSVPSAPRENSEIRERDIDAVAEYKSEGLPGDWFYAPSKKNITDKETRRSATLSQKIYRALDVGKVVNVVSEESTGINGAANIVPRRNLVNLTEARTPSQYFHAAMHELTHSLIKRNKAAYNKLLDQILPLVQGKEQFEASLQRYIAARSGRIGKAGAIEEFVCDMVADLMQTRHFWEVLSQQDMPLAVRLLAAVKKFADKISGTLDRNSELDVIFGKNLNDVIRIAAEFVTDDGKARPQSAAEVASQAEVVNAENAPATETDTAAVRKNRTTETAPSAPSGMSDQSVPIRTTPSESVQTGQSSAFTMKDGESLKNDSGKAVLIYHDKPPKGALWGNKKFKSENLYGTAQYAIVGNDVHIRFTNSAKTGKKYLFFTIPDFRDQIISEIRQAVQKIDPDSTYPLGRNFDDLLNDLHDHGMRVYPSSLKPLAPAAQTSGNRKEETAVPEKGTPKENSEVAPAETTVSKTETTTAEKKKSQTLSDKFRAKEKEITGTNNPNIIISDGLKNGQSSDTVNKEQSATNTKESQNGEKPDTGNVERNTGLSADTVSSAAPDGLQERAADRAAGEPGTAGVSGEEVSDVAGDAAAGNSDVTAVSGVRNGDGRSSTAGGNIRQRSGAVDTSGDRQSVQTVERTSSGRVRSGSDAANLRKLNKDNFRITKDTEIVPSGDISKIRANIAALQLVKKLDEEKRQATAEEKTILAKFTGWGGLPQVFQYGNQFYSELKNLLTPSEYSAARASTINAHYTERDIISRMWDIASLLGFSGGRVGEFGAGAGHFLGLIPDKLFNKTAFKAVELDAVTGKILQYLYPGADVTINGLEHTKIANNTLDMVIGNFPFAKEGPYDKNYPKFNLHNYFFARAIDAVKPGGLIVALTSNSTLDSINQDARKYFAQRADFVGAIRLPNNAFKKNAGTEVVTDIIIMRKHDGTENILTDKKNSFLNSVPVDGVSNDENNIRVNEYFIDHPEMVLGKITSSGSMYRSDTMTVEATAPAEKLPELISKAAKNLPKNIMGSTATEIVTDTADITLTDEQKKALREGEIFLDKLKRPMIYIDGNAVLLAKHLEKNISQNEMKKIQSFVKLKEVYNHLMEVMRSDASDAEVSKIQKELNSVYDEHVKKFGYLSERRKYTASNLVDDPGYLRMSALENSELVPDPKNPKRKIREYRKSDIFTSRTIKKVSVPTHADSAADAAVISINYTGKLDFQFMKNLTGKSTNELTAELLKSGDFFLDPVSGQLVERAEYLSGNILEKISQAESQLENEYYSAEFARNIEELKKVLPQPKEIGKINFTLGSTWIPAKVIENWIKKTFNVSAKVSYSAAKDKNGDASAWKVDIPGAASVSQYIIRSKDISDLIADCLNLRRTKISIRQPDGKYVIDSDATQTANSMQEELKRSFVDFVRTDSDSATMVEDVFNNTYNCFVERKIDPEKCLDVYPGASDTINGKKFRLRDHQKAVVSRCIKGNTLIAHCVGAGKTVEIITANMELIRLGLASKGLIVVQKSTLGQFAEEAQALYPNARILAADAQSVTKKKRRHFLSKIANGSYDMVIMAHPTFDNLEMSPELQRKYIQDSIDEVVIAIEIAKRESGKRSTVKELERKRKSLTARMEKLQSRENAEDTFYFDELGFDAIFVDEAHNYKKLDFHTKLGNIKGLDRSGSSRAFNMKGKLDFIRSKTGGRNIYFATGTPVTNTLAEAWNMIRMVNPEALEQFHVETFDQFASTFTRTVTSIEQNAAGTWKSVERFSEFTNIEELHKLIASTMDIVLPEDLKGVKRPNLKNGKPGYVTVDRSKELTGFMDKLKELYEAFDAASGADRKKYSAIPLMIYGLARKASIDMRLINENFADDPGSKLNAVVKNALARYKEYASEKGAQAIFCDLYRLVDKNTGIEKFNVYEEIKRKLMENGVPESEIAIINDYNTDLAKEKLFEAVNSGDVRFVMGSTEKLGTGVNIQERLCCLHHIDAPPRPSDMEQRDGRIIRQGNTISEPEILCYAVDKTLDSLAYATLARKAKFINSALKGKSSESGTLEVTDDDVIDYASFSAETSGDKRAIQYVEQKKRIQELENDKRRHQKNVYMADGNIKRHLENADLAAKGISGLKDFIAQFGNLDLKTADISVDGKKLSGDRKDIMAQLERDVFEKINSSPWQRAKINIGGLQISVYSEEIIRLTAPTEFATVYTIDNIRSQQGISIKGNANTAQGFMSSLQSLLKKKPDELAALQEKESSLRALAEQQKQIKNSTFAQENELNDLIKEHEALEKELAEDSKNKGADEKHLTLSQAISMLGLDTSDIEVEDDTDSDLKLSTTGDRGASIKSKLLQSDDLDISQMVLTETASNQTEALNILSLLAGRNITNRETGIAAQINSTQRNKLVSSKAREKSNKNGFSNNDHFAAVANIDKLFENGTMVDNRTDKNGDQNVIAIKRFVAPVLLGEDFAEAYITVKETVGDKIYSMELDELKRPSDIQGGTLKERYHIPEGYNKLLQKIEKARALLKNPENYSDDLKLSLTSDRKTAQKESLLTQVKTLFEAKEPVVDKKWVMTNRQVYQTLYRYVFPTAEFVKDMPSQREMEILNMVIESGDMSGAALVAEPYFNDEDLQLKKDFDSKRNSALDEVLDKVTAPVGKTIRKYLRSSNAKKDLSLIELALRTPMWIAKKLKDVPVVQAIYNAARMFSDDKARIYEYLRGDVIARLDAVYKADKKEYKKFAEYLFECDRNQTGAGKVIADRNSGKFIALTADNEEIGTYDTEAEAWDALFKKEREQLIAQGYSTAAGDALYEIRKQNYSTYLFIINNTLRSLRQLGLINAKSTSFIVTDASKFFPELEREENTGDIDLFEMMREMGQRSGYYMPRKRKPGKYQLWAFKAGQPPIMETFDTPLGRATRKRKLEKDGYRTENRLSDAPNQDMMAQVNPAALMDIINQAAQRSRDFIRKEITFATIDYTKKDGSTEKHLVVDGKNLPREISETLKSLGGRWIDNQWHFIKPDADTQQNITEILESEMQNRLKMTSIMQTSIMENLRDMIRENSSASFKISRRKAVGNDVVRGYFEDPMKALALYYSGIAGGTARNVMAKKMYSAYGGMDFDREQFVADLIPENLEVNSDAYNRAKLNAINEYYREVRRRALDSSKQPNIANYMSKYIQDMLRNTDGLERVVGAVKGFAAVYMLGKPVSALNNLAGAQTIVPAVISRETGRNVLFAAKDFTVGVTKYINYALYNKSGIGAAPSGIDKTIFDIIHENHWDNSEFAREATTAGMTYMGKAAHQMSNVALYLFGGVEQANRAASIRAAAIALAKKKGIELSKLSRKELFDILDESRAISDLANGVYDKSNKISVARGGGLHTIADAFMLFRTYEANLFQVYIDLIKNRNYGALAYTSAMLTLIGGVSGSIAMSMLSILLGFLGVGDDDEDKDYDERFFSWVSDKFGERSELILRYGVPSLVDINLSGTYQNTVTRMMKEKSIEPALIWTATPAMFWVDRGVNVWHYGTTGQTLKALEQLLPAGIGGIVSPSGILRAIDESIHGVTDRNARVRKDIYDRNIEPDWLAITMRSLGFNPVSISEKTERLWSEKKIRNRYSDKRRKIYTRYREYMNSGSNDTAVLADITADIDDYNARVTRSRRNIPLIDEEGLERAVKERENKFFKDSDDE